MAQYTVGIVSSTAGSSVLTFEEDGEGNAPELLANASAGDEIRIGDNPTYFTIASVDSDTQVTLTANYPTTETDETFEIVRDFSANYELPLPNQGDLHFADLMKRALQKIDQITVGMTQALFKTRDPQVIYVSTGGSDTDGNGSRSYPYASLKKAHDDIVASSAEEFIVVLSPGQYTLNATQLTSGHTAFGKTTLLQGLGGPFGEGVEVRITGADSGSPPFPANRYINFSKTSAIGLTFKRLDNGTDDFFVTFLNPDGNVLVSNCSFVNDTNDNLYLRFGYPEVGYSATQNCRFVSEGTGSVGIKDSRGAGEVVGCVFDDGAYGSIVFETLGGSNTRLTKAHGNKLTGTASNLTIRALSISANYIDVTGTVYLYDFENASGNTIKASLYAYLQSTTEGATLSANDVLVASMVVACENVLSNRFTCNSTSSGVSTGLISLSPDSGRVWTVADNTIISSVPFMEDPPDDDLGHVSAIERLSGPGHVVIRNNYWDGKGIFLMNSHPTRDATRQSQSRTADVMNNTLITDKQVISGVEGPDDVHALIVHHGAGLLRSVGNAFVGKWSNSIKTTMPHCAIWLSSELTSLTQDFVSVNDFFDVEFPAGTITLGGGNTTSPKCVIGANIGSLNALSALVVNPTMRVNGNQNHIFGGLGSPEMTVAGVISCNVAVTYQNAPAGSYQLVRGDLAVSALTTTGGAAAGYRAVGNCGNDVGPGD